MLLKWIWKYLLQSFVVLLCTTMLFWVLLSSGYVEIDVGLGQKSDKIAAFHLTPFIQIF